MRCLPARASPPDGFSQHHCDGIPEAVQQGHPYSGCSGHHTDLSSKTGGYAARVAARLRSLSSSIAGWHGDERTVGSPLNDAELIALRRTRLFGATGTVLMAIGALGVGRAARRAGPDVRGAAAQPAVAHPDGVADDDHHRRGDDGAGVADARPLRARRPADDAQPARPHPAAVGAAAAHRAADVQQGRLLLSGAERDRHATASTPTASVPRRDWASTTCSRCRCRAMWRETPAPYGPLFLWIGQRHLGADRREHRRRGAVPPAGGAARRRADRLGDAAAGPPLRRRRGQRAVAGRGQPAADHASGRGHPQRGADARA